MAEHFFRHFTSTIGTTTPPNTEVWSMSGTNCKIIESFGVSKIPAHDKIRSTSFSGSENLQIRKWLEMYFYNYAMERLEICKFGLLDN